MADAAQAPRSNRPTRHRIDWGAARAYFVGLGPARSFGKVAREFGVSDTAVRNHAHAEGWEEAGQKEDAALAEFTLRETARSRQERVAEVLKLVDASLDRYRAQLPELEVKPSDVPALVKLAELLEGEATERVTFDEMQQGFRVAISVAVDVVSVVAAELLDGRAEAFVKAYRERYLVAVNEALGAGGE